MSGRSRSLRIAGFAVAFAVLAFVIAAADPAAVWDVLGEVDLPLALVIVLLNLPLLALFTLRSRLVLSHMGFELPFAVLFPVSVLGNVAAAVTPAGAGEVLRANALRRAGGLGLGSSVAMVTYERVLSTYLLLLSTLALLAVTSLDGAARAAVVAACAGAAFLPWLSAVVILPRLPASQSVTGGGPVHRLLGYALVLAEQIRVLLVSLPLYLAWSSLTLASFAVVALQFTLAARSIDAGLAFADAWVAFGGSVAATIASLLPLGLGVGDGSIAAIVNHAGVPFERATAVAVLVRALTTLPLLLAALASYAYLQRSGRSGEEPAP